MQCSESPCSFYANDGCMGLCSHHSWIKSKEILAAIRPSLSEDLLRIIVEYAGFFESTILTDDQIVDRLHVDPSTILIESASVQERLLWMRNHRTTQVARISDILDFSGDENKHKYLRKEDAERLMVCLDIHKTLVHDSRCEIEKIIVQKTFHSASLTPSLFPVGLCYHGGKPCTSKMTSDEIRTLVVRCAAHRA